MLEVKNVTIVFNKGTVNEKVALNDVSLTLKDGDFVTVIGSNGAGKSTLLNLIAGVYKCEEGSISIDGIDITKSPEYKRSKYFGRVFQDPQFGTCSDMWVEENMSIAEKRGKRRGLGWAIKKNNRARYRELLKELDLGLEDRLTTKMGLLSGGQRQSITLLMATMNNPKVLLLDEHTAALDPKTAEKVLNITDKIVTENHLTTLMITHNMRDAITHGNRLIMMNNGKIIFDVEGEDKKNLTVEDLIAKFTQASGQEFANDRALLSK